MATPHKIPGVSGGRDENGIITMVQPWWCETVEQCFEVGDAMMMGIPESRRDFGVWDPNIVDAGYQIGITYQGLQPGREPGANEETFDMESDISVENIGTHPNIRELMETYQGRIETVGEEEKIIFDQIYWKDEEATTRKYGFAREIGSKVASNPMYGKETWELYGAIWTHTYVRGVMPQNLLSRIGQVVKRPPGNPPTPSNRDWAIQGPTVSIYKGGGVKITDRYKLSPPGGWPEHFGLTLVV